MLLDLMFWSFLVALLPFALDLAIQLTAVIAQGVASTIRGPLARPGGAVGSVRTFCSLKKSMKGLIDFFRGINRGVADRLIPPWG